EQLIQGGTVSPAVLYNQGNALLRLGRLGEAIARYRQALRLSPRDPDVIANLELARSRVEGESHPAIGWRALAWLSANEWAIAALALNFLGGALLVARAFPPRLRAIGPGGIVGIA